MRNFNLLSRFENWMEGLSSRIRPVSVSYPGSQSLALVTERQPRDEREMTERQNATAKVYQGYSKGIRFAATILVLLFIGVGSAWGEEVIYTLDGTTTATGNAYATATNLTQNSINWSVMGNTELNPWGIGGKKITNAVRPVYSKTAISSNVTKVEVTYGDDFTLSSASAVLKVYSTAADAASGSSSNLISTVSGGEISANGKHTFLRPDGHDWTGRFYRFEFTCTHTSNSNKKFEFTKAEFFAGTSCTSISPTLSYSADSIGIGGTASVATLNKDGSTGSVTYSISPASGVATINSTTGQVTGTGTGNVTVTATIAAEGGKCEGTATATIKVRRGITYYIGSTSYTVGGVDGNTLLSTLPKEPISCDGENYPYFYGWKNGSISGSTTTKPTLLSTEVVNSTNAANTYYAVFTDKASSTTEYTFTNKDWNATSGGSTANWTNGSSGNGFTDGQGNQITSGRSGANATSPVSFSNVTNVLVTYNTNQSAGAGAVKIKIGSNEEVSHDVAYGGSGDGKSANYTTSFDFSPALTGTVKLTVTCTTNSIWLKSIAITTGSSSSAHYITTCCTPLAQINGSVNLTNDGCGAGELKATWKTNSDGLAGIASQVLHIYKASDDSEITGKKVTGLTASTDNQTQTISGLDNCTAYYVKVENISNGGSYCGDGWAGDASSSANTKGYTYSIGKSNVSLKAGTDEEASTCAGNFSAQYEAAAGYELPATLTVSGASAHTWSVSEGVGTLTINAANVTGNVSTTIAGTCITPNITADPASAVYSLNESATPLSVTVEGAGAWCGYQWESKVGNGNWTPIQNATSSSYTPSTASAGSTTLYHVIVSNIASGCSTSSTSEAATILVSALPVCASPTFSEAAGTKLGAQSITLSCEDGDATIYYTTNGDDPQEIAADLYDGSAIAVNQTTTIKAIAAKSGTTTSAVVSATYTIQCKAPTANVSAGTYNVEKSVELSSEYGTVYYTTDGSDPASGTAYNGAIAVSQTTTIRAIAKRANCENSEEFSATYTLKCATPTFSVAAGTHTGAQNVELSCTTDGAAIHYTTNGNDPTGSSPAYSEAIAVSSAQTIKAIATKSGWSNSDIAEAAYTIQYAVKWYVGGTEEANVVSTTYVNAGSKVAPIADRDGDEIGTCATDFMGWTTSALRNGSVPQTADHYTTLFKNATASASLPTISEATSYYAVFAKEGTGTVTVTDELTYESIGLGIATSGTATYTDFSGVTATSDAVYAGNINKFNSSSDPTNTIQLRSKNSSTGIVTTVSGGKAKKVTVTWNASTAATRTITIYGKNTTAYSAATDLYDNDNKGEQLGELNVDNATNNVSELTITGDYEFIGIRSKSGALYLDEVDIQWETTGTTLTDYVTECPAVVAPTFDTAEGTYNAAQTVKISNYNSDYLYFYTTDNSDPAADANLDPTGTSAVYDNATGIAINGSCTLKAVAYNEDVVASAINSAAYVLKVATPTISGNTSFVSSTMVTIEATGADHIYYTTDGSDPDNTKSEYSAPFTVDATTTIKAIAVKANWTSSEVAEQVFTKVTPLTVATALSNINALDNNGTIADQYVKGLISQIVSYNSGNTITYYISDDGTTTSQLQVYKGSAGVANGGNAFTSADDLKVGEEVIVSGTLKKYVSGNKTTPEFVNPNEIVAYKPFAPMAWSANAYTAELGGSSNVFPSLSGTAGLTISYSSSDETVAEISADGTTYNLKKVGSTTITATSEANASYVATSKSYTLTVEAAVTRYSLSYVKNGGTSDATDSEGETETNLPNPLPEVTKTGKNFGGWYTDNTFETPAVAGAALTENTTLYAQWLDPYTVAEALTIIDALDNDEKTAENVYVAGVVTDDAVDISNSSATYYIKDASVDNRLEVYKGKGLNNADVTAGDILEGDQLVVYGQLMKYKGYSATAKPEIVNPNYIYSQVRPTYDVTGVTVASTANVRAGKTITLTATIEPANATDKAVTWSSDAEGVATVDENGVVTGVAEGTAHITVTTHDGEFQATCTVTVAGALPTFTEDDHEWIKISNASKLVAGRFYVIGESSKGVTATNVLSSNYLAKVATTITDGVIASGSLGTNTAIFELGGNATDGWTLYELMDEENTGYLSGTNTSSLSWSASAATTSISFDENGNAILGDADSYRMLYNGSNNPRFKGYNSDLSASMLLPQLYMWAELSHSVTFDANGGVAESVPGVERTDEGKIIIPATTPTHSDISKAFAGWYKSDAPATLYNAGDEFETNVDVTLYAKWNSVPTYTVTYVPGGTGTVPAVASYREGQKVQVEEASLSNPGYSFAGWTVKDAEQNVLPLDEENKFDMPASNVTITAVWSRISNQKWTLVKQGETLEIDAEYVIAYNSNTVKKALGAISSNIGTPVDVTIDGEILKGSDAMKVLTLKAGNGGENYAFQSGSKYLTWSSGNTLNESETPDDASSWTIEIDENNVATISNVSTVARKLQYNTSSPRFACYTGSQKDVQLYKKAASVVINGEQTVNAADITANADVTIKNGGTLNIDADKTIGDLTVENGGQVVLDANKLTVVGTFTIETTMASGNSGQLNGAMESNFEAGEAYIDITLGAGGTNQQWHAFTVPFPVDAMNGIYDLDGNKLTNEVNYAIMDYHGDIRAKGQYGWKKYRGVLVPGTFYIMATDGYRTTYRFKKTANSALVASNSKTIYEYAASGDAQTTDAGWNGVGNPNLFYGKVNLAVQVLDPTSYTFVTKTAQSTNFVVGTPFFYQATANGSMVMETANAGGNYAPARERAIEIKDVPVSFGNEDFNDYLYVTANEDALNTYETGKDLAKMTMTNTPKVAQIFGKAYNTKLCMVHAPMVNDQAEVALELYAPQAGTYTISVPAEREDASLYLTYEGNIIWDLTVSPYEAEFEKGQNNDYGLMIVRKAPQVTTGVETIDNSQSTIHNCQKVILNDHVYILRDAQLYDVTGKAVK